MPSTLIYHTFTPIIIIKKKSTTAIANIGVKLKVICN